jgi:hypothetical protein
VDSLGTVGLVCSKVRAAVDESRLFSTANSRCAAGTFRSMRHSFPDKALRGCGSLTPLGFERRERHRRSLVGRYRRIVRAMATVEYRYELRRGEEIVATGHLSHDQPFRVGEQVRIGVHTGIVQTVEPTLGERELRLAVRLGE